MRHVSSTFRHRAAATAALWFFVVTLGTILVSGGQAKMRTDILKVTTQSGEHTFNIEVAETAEEKAQGLMFRRQLADDAGMLFPYEPPGEATMWMKNTYISLDMVFIREDGIVHRIETGTEPFSERVISSRGPVSAVLELKAGIADRIGLKPGDKVSYRMFKSRR